MIPRIVKDSKISMEFLTGISLVNVKKIDAVYECNGEAWYFKTLGAAPKNGTWPRGIMAYAGTNMSNGKFLSEIEMKFYSQMELIKIKEIERSSPDFETYEEAVNWMIENLEDILTKMCVPILGPEWKDIKDEYIVFCSHCEHFIGYREKRNNEAGQGQYFSCKIGRNPDEYKCDCRKYRVMQ